MLTHSSVHGIVVPIGLLWALGSCQLYPWQGGGSEVYVAMECREMEIFFSFTVAYFVFDFGLCVYYQIELWPVFAVHHIIGATPFAVSCFIPGGQNLPFLLGLGLCVEFTNPIQNTEHWLVATGRGDTTACRILIGVGDVVWLVFRISIPMYLMVIMFGHAIPKYGGIAKVIPTYITGSAIFLFCFAVFFFIRMPKSLERAGLISKETLEETFSPKSPGVMGDVLGGIQVLGENRLRLSTSDAGTSQKKVEKLRSWLQGESDKSLAKEDGLTSL